MQKSLGLKSAYLCLNRLISSCVHAYDSSVPKACSASNVSHCCVGVKQFGSGQCLGGRPSVTPPCTPLNPIKMENKRPYICVALD